MGRWGDGEMGRWGDGEMGRCLDRWTQGFSVMNRASRINYSIIQSPRPLVTASPCQILQRFSN
ncbi:MAG: hypothetical protein F6K23_14470 [Okeania sp. SIO2C9]|uniref:hypothetical protein n=1 Tax=Okeania sp. SIO2C9 TaxID=2607791 RepID=UPI0013BF27D4|nr:hypothetical protein [Okeania sp. SIO2C9]NEQ74136.1 hypothetical protein [Okeania sp. SIO2C9]